jgi:glycosyltransferase involved in cell wall biosynthesis
MHVLFVHQNFPAQFGHVAAELVRRGHRCSFVSARPAGRNSGVELIQYRPVGGATRQNHYCSRTFENTVAHAHGVYEALKARPEVRPDLVVGHSGFGSTIFLRELYRCPVINYFEYFYRPRGSDLDFRPDFPVDELTRLRCYARNAMILCDLDNCDLGYSPTRWQRDLLPGPFRDKVRVVFDGIDTATWRPLPRSPRRVGSHTFPADVRIVTYATRGMEAMRGFDVFMRFAKKLCERRSDVVFLIAGQDRVCYGGDARLTGGRSLKEWVLGRDDYDLSRFHFLGLLPPAELAQLFAVSDLHVYLTVPFVLSWSLLNALACGATVLASDTAPVREVIRDGENGLLADFFDADGMVERAERVLARPDDYRHLGRGGVELVRDRYSLDVCLPEMLRLYRDAAPAPPALDACGAATPVGGPAIAAWADRLGGRHRGAALT